MIAVTQKIAECADKNVRASPIVLEDCHDRLESRTSILIGTQRLSPPRNSFNSLYKTHGFDYLPTDAQVLVCPTDAAAEGAAQKFCDLLDAAFVSKGAKPGMAKRVTLNRLQHRLDCRLQTNTTESVSGVSVLLFMPDKRREPSPTECALMSKLERCDIPFRRAYASDNFVFSIPTQLTSIVSSIGGVPHRLDIQGITSRRKLGYLGIDLSHRTAQRYSALCAALVSADGQLNLACRKRQALDETVHPTTLRSVLETLHRTMVRHSEIDGLVVLRDGRVFENERAELYSDILGLPVSLLEIRKGGNPHLMVSNGRSQLPAAASWGLIPESTVGFLYPAPHSNSGGIGKTLKVSWRARENQLELSPHQISALLTGLTLAPSLGDKIPSLPAPIYWADGIAGSNDKDLRFRGQPVCDLG